MRDKREIIREEMAMRRKIVEILKDGPKTVSEVAEALGKPTPEVMFWMMAMRKYALIEETEEVTEDGYYKYRLKEGRK